MVKTKTSKAASRRDN